MSDGGMEAVLQQPEMDGRPALTGIKRLICCDLLSWCGFELYC
jgi:hypothetical protein